MSTTASCKFEVRHISGAGRGMFACAPIQVGSCLLTEDAAVEVWSEPQRHTLDGSPPKPPSLIVATALAAERSATLRGRLLSELCPLGDDFETLWSRFERHALSLDQAAEERAYDAFVFGLGDSQNEYLATQEEALPDVTRQAALNLPLADLFASAQLQTEAAARADSISCSDDVVRRLSAIVDGIAPECPSLSRRDLVKLALSCMYNAFQLALPFDDDDVPPSSGSAPSTSLPATDAGSSLAFAHAPAARRPGSTGRGLFIATSLLNHSCWPNCAWSPMDPRDIGSAADGRTRLQLRATRDIAPGEQLTISYLDLTLPPQRRSLSLLQSYRFECSCARCTAHNVRTSCQPGSSEFVAAAFPLPMSDAPVCSSVSATDYARSPARPYFDAPITDDLRVCLPASDDTGSKSCVALADVSAGAAADLLTQGVWCSAITTALSSLPRASPKSLPFRSAPVDSPQALLTLSALVTAAPAAQEWVRSPAVALATEHLAATGALAVADTVAAAGMEPQCAGMMCPQLGHLGGPSGALASLASEPCPVFCCGTCGLSLPFAAVYGLLTALETGVAPLRPRAAHLRFATPSQAAADASDATSSAVALVRDAERVLATVRALTPPQSWLCARATDAALLAAAAATTVWAHAETSAVSAATAAELSNRLAEAAALRASASEFVGRRYIVSQSSALIAVTQAAAWRTLLPRHHPKLVVSSLRAAAALAAVAARAAAGDGSTVHTSPSQSALTPLAEAEWAGLLCLQSAQGPNSVSVKWSSALTELIRLFHRSQRELVSTANLVSPPANDAASVSEASAARLVAAGQLQGMPQCRAWAQNLAPVSATSEPQLCAAIAALEQAVQSPSDARGSAHPRGVRERLLRMARSLPSCAVTTVVMLVAEATVEYSVCYGSSDDAVNAHAFTELVRTSFKVPLASLLGLVALHYLA